ncbi:galactosyltransferase [Campylobacter coli]|nr:galactosyltransferase [Campylobacter coli]EAH9787938.1 galactosyltransferase [Campylobacter coli]EAI2575405.1 galactosyltransferase [Campylobacter coli]EAI9957038.1 galactosyltransferase [Campylobacter coli]EAJ5753421.1 galactosyltransferase [Campylobacter coli]
MRRLAICLYGHCRTFELTYQNFFKFVVNENKLDGYEIDIFFHTWDVYHESFGSWHKHNSFFNKVSLGDMGKRTICEIYKPKLFSIEHLNEGQHGVDISLDRVNMMREKYSMEHHVAYDYILYTRMDIMFLYPFKINSFLDSYNHIELKSFTPKINEKFLFVANNCFTRFKIADFRYPNEGDLLWFSNFSSKRPFFENNCNIVLLDYRAHNHFYIARANILTQENIWKKLDEQERYIKEQKNLLIEEKYKFDLLSFRSKHGTAKSRIQNQLSYKLGQTMIINSKNIFGVLFMPAYIISTLLSHRQEKKIYQEKIKKDPSLKLPSLENYPDYKEALKEKECFTYKLGETLIRANNNWYGGGYIKLLFEIRKLKKEFKKK